MLARSMIALFALTLLPAIALADPPPTLTKEQAHFVVTEVERLISEHYVFPEKRQMIVDALKKADAGGRYDTTDARELGERLTDDLRAVANDRHLSAGYRPEMYADLTQAPHTGAAPRHPDNERMHRMLLRHNHGYEELRMLPGNVRYVRISGFMWSPESTPRVIDDAARFLADGEAMIIDLRGDGGGNADAVERMISYFFPKGSNQELMTFHDGLEGTTIVNRVVANLTDARLTGKPFYLLIDGGTASAAEEFTYHTQQFKLGTIVGATTAGAANNNVFFPVAPGFAVSISVGRPVHPVSHTNWEGVGIAPDVSVPPAVALEQAEILALNTLLARTSGADRATYEWAIAGLQAQIKPIRLTEAEMRVYVGVYGVRRVFIADGLLKYQREDLPPATLTPMGDDLFALSNTDEVRIRFRRKDGRVVGFDQVFSGGEPSITIDRTSP